MQCHMSSTVFLLLSLIMLRHASVKQCLQSFCFFFKAFKHTFYSGANASFKLHVLSQGDVIQLLCKIHVPLQINTSFPGKKSKTCFSVANLTLTLLFSVISSFHFTHNGCENVLHLNHNMELNSVALQDILVLYTGR